MIGDEKIGEFYLEKEKATHLKLWAQKSFMRTVYKETREREESVKRQPLVSY